MTKFEVGDIVHLNSGSPELTVTKIHEGHENGPIVAVCWLLDGDFREAGFPAACLRKAVTPEAERLAALEGK